MKATILLAEDERDMREVLCDYFTAKSGGELTVISAPDGNTALHLIETQPFDLLLLDIMLPGTDGFALCRAAREQGEAPILFITAREDEQDKLHGYGLGADDYVVKAVFARSSVRQGAGASAPGAWTERRRPADRRRDFARPSEGNGNGGRQTHQSAAQGICFAAGADGAQKPRADPGRTADPCVGLGF